MSTCKVHVEYDIFYFGSNSSVVTKQRLMNRKNLFASLNPNIKNLTKSRFYDFPFLSSQQANACSKSTIVTLEQGMKYVQS